MVYVSPLLCNVGEGAETQYPRTVYPHMVDQDPSKIEEHIKYERKFANCKVVGFTAACFGPCAMRVCVCHGDERDQFGYILSAAYLGKVLSPAAFMRQKIPGDQIGILDGNDHRLDVNFTAEARMRYHKMTAEARARCNEDTGVRQSFITRDHVYTEDQLGKYRDMQRMLDNEIKKVAASDKASRKDPEAVDMIVETAGHSIEALVTTNDIKPVIGFQEASGTAAMDPTHPSSGVGSEGSFEKSSPRIPVVDSVAAQSLTQKIESDQTGIAVSISGIDKSKATQADGLDLASQTEDTPFSGVDTSRSKPAQLENEHRTVASGPSGAANDPDQMMLSDTMARTTISGVDNVKASLDDEKYLAQSCNDGDEAPVKEINVTANTSDKQDPEIRGWGTWLRGLLTFT